MGDWMRTVCLALLITVMTVGIAAADCGDAVDSYNSAISEIEYQLGRYTRCVSNSAGEDDCNSEFRRLRGAQDDFESAVSDYRNECDQ